MRGCITAAVRPLWDELSAGFALKAFLCEIPVRRGRRFTKELAGIAVLQRPALPKCRALVAKVLRGSARGGQPARRRDHSIAASARSTRSEFTGPGWTRLGVYTRRPSILLSGLPLSRERRVSPVNKKLWDGLRRSTRARHLQSAARPRTSRSFAEFTANDAVRAFQQMPNRSGDRNPQVGRLDPASVGKMSGEVLYEDQP